MKISAHFKHLFQSRHITKEHKATNHHPETYYLIDFENVHEDGLGCSVKLSKHDHIHIFSTANAPKISIEKLAALNFARLFSHVIPAGKQSLDMHLVSYLGYLIGANSNNRCKYVIISKDTDYDNIVTFFKTLASVKITRQDSMMAALTLKQAVANKNIANIKPASANNNASNVKKAPVGKSSSNIKKTSVNKNSSKKASSKSQKRVQLNSNIQKAVSKAGYDNTIINKTASIVLKHYGKSNFADNVFTELKAVYPKHYIDLYIIIKPLIGGTTMTAPVNKVTSTQPDNTIQTILSKAGYNKDIIAYVASSIEKHKNENTYKQKIYGDITKKYGQAKGRDIYTRIKKKL